MTFEQNLQGWLSRKFVTLSCVSLDYMKNTLSLAREVGYPMIPPHLQLAMGPCTIEIATRNRK